MTARPLVTFSLTAYRQEQYVRQAVRGALAQTYSPLEIVIADDCSPDGTFAAIEEEIARYKGPHTVRAWRNDRNLGSPANRMETYRRSSGEFVIVAEGDDVSHPDRTMRSVETWKERGVSVVTCNGYWVDQTGTQVLKIQQELDRAADDSIDTLARRGSNAMSFGPGLAISRELIDTFGVPPARFQAGDLVIPFWGALLRGCTFLNELLVKYRVHDGNSSVGRRVDRASGIDRTVEEERQWFLHAAIVKWELEELAAWVQKHPDRAPLEQRLQPLLVQQLFEHSTRWLAAREVLDAAGRKFVGRAA